MVNYYNHLKKGDVDLVYGLESQTTKHIDLNDSSVTDKSTAAAIMQLRPKCPLRMQELISREIISDKKVVNQRHQSAQKLKSLQKNIPNDLYSMDPKSIFGNFGISQTQVNVRNILEKKIGQIEQQASAERENSQTLNNLKFFTHRS